MSKFNWIMVWSITTTVSFWVVSFNWIIKNSNLRVDWSALYDENHYAKQEEIYMKFRPTLLSNTLVVPNQTIREHIAKLAANDYLGIRQQVEAFHRTNKKTSRRKIPNFIQYQLILSESQSSATPVDVINHLRIYDIEINSISNNEIDAHYLLIEGKFDRIEISEMRMFLFSCSTNEYFNILGCYMESKCIIYCHAL